MPRLALLLACLLAPTQGLVAQDWATRYPPAPDCALQWVRHPGDPARPASLVVLPVIAGTDSILAWSQVALTPLARVGLDSTPRTPWNRPHPESFRFDSLVPGAYQLRVLSVGRGREVDTIEIIAGSADTVRAGLLEFLTHYRNTHNCRPHGFRRPGERACVTEGEMVEVFLAAARRYADPEENVGFHLLPFDSSEVRLVKDERICRRAGLAYDSTSPPRRVIVIQAGLMYLVYDPFEPLYAGEFDAWMFFDRQWRTIANLVG